MIVQPEYWFYPGHDEPRENSNEICLPIDYKCMNVTRLLTSSKHGKILRCSFWCLPLVVNITLSTWGGPSADLRCVVCSTHTSDIPIFVDVGYSSTGKHLKTSLDDTKAVGATEKQQSNKKQIDKINNMM